MNKRLYKIKEITTLTSILGYISVTGSTFIEARRKVLFSLFCCSCGYTHIQYILTVSNDLLLISVGPENEYFQLFKKN